MENSNDFVPLRERGKYNNDGNLLSNKPETEQQLFKYQDLWLQTRDRKVWTEMQALVYSYTQSLVKKKLTNKKFLEADEVDDAAAEATFSFMAQYLRPNKDGSQFEIGASFAGLINYKVMEALYKDCPEDVHVSLNTIINQERHVELLDNYNISTEYNSSFNQNISNPEDIVERVDLKEEIELLLNEIDQEINDIYICTIVRLYLVLCLKKPRSRHAKECFIKTWVHDQKLRDILDATLIEIHNRLFKTSITEINF